MLSQMQETILIIFTIFIFSWKVLFHLVFSRFRAVRAILKKLVLKLLLPWILKYIKIYFLFLSLWMHVSKAQPNPTTYCILSKQAIGEAMLFEASKKSSLLTSTYLFVECIQSFSKENELLPIRLELIYCFIAGMRPSLFRIFLEKWKILSRPRLYQK